MLADHEASPLGDAIDDEQREAFALAQGLFMEGPA
jgi:hypothetical protein